MLLSALLGAFLAVVQGTPTRCAPETTPSEDAEVVLRRVTVVSVHDGTMRPNQDLLIREGIIEAIGTTGTLALPARVRIHDLPGKFVTPGLIDFHVHLRDTTELLSYLRHGVTTIIQLSGGLRGAPGTLGYRSDLLAGRRIGPTLYTTGPILDGDPPINPSVSTAIASAADAAATVRRQAATCYDLVKVYNRLPAAALGAAVDEAHRLGKVVVGHVPRTGDRATALPAALDARLDVIVHGEEFFFTHFHAGVDELLDQGVIPWRDTSGVGLVAQRVRDAGTAVIPNLSFVAATRTQLDSIDRLWSDPEFEYLAPAVRDEWRERNFRRVAGVDRFSRRERAKEALLDRLTLALSRAGVPLFLGTDASAVGLFPGASAHLELEQLVEAGLTPAAAIAAGTVTPGAFLCRRGIAPLPLGIVEQGARADLLVLDANPLSDVTAMKRIEAVVSRGRYFAATELDRLRMDARRTSRERP
ncbi:MAG TPA: amidohydrolase family protein [Gemmatimonadaceae bacterium]